uniref:Alternative protein LOC100134052 n=1 Tax=Homo sapiens TaxID=9606 RepID=L8ECQ2_HUMAN|nr:alternative protein LOC100134052 [Homo sapiens]
MAQWVAPQQNTMAQQAALQGHREDKKNVGAAQEKRRRRERQTATALLSSARGA